MFSYIRNFKYDFTCNVKILSKKEVQEMNNKSNENIECVIENEDLKIIENMAEKYCVSVQELGRIISRRNGSYPRLQILLNVEELNSIDKKAKELNLSRTKYCSLCYRKALKEKLYDDIDIIQAMSEKQTNKLKREHRAVISFDNAKDYREMKKLADSLGIPFSSLMRYFALNVKL